ncbi:hypothetical protein AMIS_31860 [Actinoplanes missouriensis 431]|uniref:Glycosyltransferase n=1 Tax=Actinoplanes missouriensis (strain ATCC 14538 / DSM 43046 / CBS 188.64 / JCM 3121 / NBRC 102363 / NCIMB 12654 / NRRL B-3342 / UNCC 431) TaxID=512565 RepID=I0H5W9_ACTM4|nr:hypothetical protein [Actinoplanes missouriensis]BAL88406.1 hypothetical protein AMIS_31860 [Actinoplanes missouriensis 431]
MSRAGQRAHHNQLLRRVAWEPGLRPNGGPIEAIVVPAARRAHRLRTVAELAADCGAVLVVLASHDCDLDKAAAEVARIPGCRALLAAIPDDGAGRLTPATSAERFRALSAGRSSNLSLKRNLGLLLARHLGWQKIMFVDDDIIRLTPHLVARVAHHLDGNRYAGLRTVSFPDNSVVCHAIRAIGRPQGIFVSGAALGVNVGADLLDVFPDAYNEDWFALAGEARRNGVADVGEVRQLEFDPFDDPQRAAFEEFGDLVAEGLYGLFNDGFDASRATADYWEGFIEERAELIMDIRRQHGAREHVQAVKSLNEALYQLDRIRPADCVAFLRAWAEDQTAFAARAQDARENRCDYPEAFTELGITRWREASFGHAPLSLAGARR